MVLPLKTYNLVVSYFNDIQISYRYNIMSFFSKTISTCLIMLNFNIEVANFPLYSIQTFYKNQRREQKRGEKISLGKIRHKLLLLF